MVEDGVTTRARIAAVFNSVSAGCIPLESFLALDGDGCDRKIVVLDRSKSEVLSLVDHMYGARGVEIEAVDARGRRNSLKHWVRFVEAVRHGPPDILHAHHRASALITAVIARVSLPKCRLIVTIHGDLSRERSCGYRLVQCLLVAFAHQVICVSEAAAESVPNWLRARDGKLRVIHNGVDLERLDRVAVQSTGGPLAGKFVVTTAGRLVGIKQYELLVEACAILVRRGHDRLRLSIIGDGPERQRLERRVDRLGLAGHVTFAGLIGRDDVYRHVCRSDLFVMPSRSEGFCNAVVEAMAMGVAVVVSDIPVFREVVEVGCGRHFTAGSAADLAASIEWFMLNPDDLRMCGDRARESARARFSLSKCVASHRALYTSIGLRA